MSRFNEPAPGYGRCVYRCLSEAVRFADTELVVLCEGDLTFRAYDIEKLVAYAAHGDVVNGTRTSEPLRQHTTQLTTFMYYGNIFVGKLLEAIYTGSKVSKITPQADGIEVAFEGGKGRDSASPTPASAWALHAAPPARTKARRAASSVSRAARLAFT